MKRCPWSLGDPLYISYHDREWGVPLHGERALFELLILEGAQAGLAWITILRKREGYRSAFDGFDPRRIARYDQRKLSALLADPGIVRNRAKLTATLENARALLRFQEEHGSFSRHLWDLAGGAPRQNRFRSAKDVPAETPASRRMSDDLRRRGFHFVGPTICYAFMQAAGMVNDHLVSCFRHPVLAAEFSSAPRSAPRPNRPRGTGPPRAGSGRGGR